MSDSATNLGKKQDAVFRLKAALDKAIEYVDLVGKPQAGSSQTGRLHRVFVETSITHYATPGAGGKNVNADFDDAIEDLIREKFPTFARMALAHIRARYEKALREQHAELTAALAEIHALNAKAPTYVHVGNSPEAAPRHHCENLPLRILKAGDTSYSELWADHDQGWERLGELNRESFMKNGAAEYYIPTAAPVRNN